MLKRIAIAAAVVGVMALNATVATVAMAAEAKRPYTVQDEVVRAECGDCHVTFAPMRLTATAWSKIMSNLSDHFGEDASMDVETAKHIEAYLVKNALDRPGKDGKMGIRTKMRLAAWKKKGFVDPIRISVTPEWTRHHTKARRYKVMAKDVGYDGPNCIKCHKGAERGYYEDFGDLYSGGE